MVFEKYWNLATQQYHVDPLIFIFLYVITIPVYYYGIGIIGKNGVTYIHEQHKKSKSVNVGDFIKQDWFIKGFVINRFGWFAPYIYVMLFGRNLPLFVYLSLIGWLFVSSYLFINKTHKDSHSKHKLMHSKVSGKSVYARK